MWNSSEFKISCVHSYLHATFNVLNVVLCGCVCVGGGKDLATAFTLNPQDEVKKEGNMNSSRMVKIEDQKMTKKTGTSDTELIIFIQKLKMIGYTI